MPSVQTLNASAIAEELRASRVAMLDGPQALAAKGTAIRVCERQSAAVGKTPDFRPDLKKPFAGFICSSIDLFAALMHEGIAISPPGFIGGANEVYPGHIWILLGGRRTLPRKTTEQGRLMRKHILEILGVCGLPSLPTHDQNDAALAALIAAAADDQVPGIRVLSIGAPLSVSPDGVLREGPMAVVLVGNPAASRIADTVRNLDLSHNSAQEPKTSASITHATTADELHAFFIAKAIDGDPQVCTYGWAYRRLFNASYQRFSQAFARQVIELACRTCRRELPGLGSVRLDTFIVSQKDGLPSAGYWAAAHHDRDEWERALGNAKVLD